jgi:hypothetical protein
LLCTLREVRQGAAFQEVHVMSAKIVVLMSTVLFGCRGAVLHAETNESRQRTATVAPVVAVAPLHLDAADVGAGGCSARSLGGSAEVSRRSMERIPIAWRSTGVVLSAWRVAADSEQGPGGIVLVERPDGSGSYYLGEGIFAGCSQSTLSSAYRRLARTNEPIEAETLQLG